jgi:hypothetical protein
MRATRARTSEVISIAAEAIGREFMVAELYRSDVTVCAQKMRIALAEKEWSPVE